MLSYDYPKTNNPFEIAEFIFQNIQNGDVLGIYEQYSNDNWSAGVKAWILSKSCKITDIILDTDKNNNVRRSFILREPFISKEDNCSSNLDSKNKFSINKCVLYRYTIVKMLVKGYGICINFSSCIQKDRRIIKIDTSKFLKDMGYLDFPRITYDGYVIEKTEDYLMDITEHLKNCYEVYEDELYDFRYMIDYFYHIESWPTYYSLRQRFWHVFSTRMKVYKESDFEKSKKLSQSLKTINSMKLNSDVKLEDDKDAKLEDDKLEDNSNMKSNVKINNLNNLKLNSDTTFNKFNIGDIVEDYNGNVGYISKIITKNITLYNKIMDVYRYKWQPLYLKSNELDLKTPVSLFYKRIGTHVFITRENEEQVAKYREKLQETTRLRQETVRLRDEYCKKLKNVENHAKKVTEQVKNVVKNVKTSTPDDSKPDDSNNVKPTDTKSTTKSDTSPTIEQTKDFDNLNKYLKTDNNSPKTDNNSPKTDNNSPKTDNNSPKTDNNSPKTDNNSPKTDNNSPKTDNNSPSNLFHDTPALPNKIDFNTSNYGVVLKSGSNYTAEKEKALCNTINDIIEFLRYLE